MEVDRNIPHGPVHTLPNDLREALLLDASVLQIWSNLTPLARNEWICWIDSAKKPDTRQRRVNRTISELRESKRRPCCWAGCSHRKTK